MMTYEHDVQVKDNTLGKKISYRPTVQPVPGQTKVRGRWCQADLWGRIHAKRLTTSLSDIILTSWHHFCKTGIICFLLTTITTRPWRTRRKGRQGTRWTWRGTWRTWWLALNFKHLSLWSFLKNCVLNKIQIKKDPNFLFILKTSLLQSFILFILKTSLLQSGWP